MYDIQFIPGLSKTTIRCTRCDSEWIARTYTTSLVGNKPPYSIVGKAEDVFLTKYTDRTEYCPHFSDQMLIGPDMVVETTRDVQPIFMLSGSGNGENQEYSDEYYDEHYDSTCWCSCHDEE